jgi:transposase-like protein
MKTKAPKTAHYRIHQMSIAQFEKQFPHEEACKAYLMANRWHDGVVRCPRCGAEATPHGTMPYHWQCYNCSAGTSYRFSVLVDTIFENTNKPLRDWFRVMHLMLTSKKGISALQVMRYMGFGSYKTAWLMCSKIRTALGNTEFKQLVGYVEVDETFVGGKAKNKHKGKGGRGDFGGTGGTKKDIVVGAVQRKGNVIARVIEHVDAATLGGFVREVVSNKVSLLSADEHGGYTRLGRDYPLGVVHHARDEYVCGAIHTNTIEGFWSIVKRGIVGTFHKVSKKYLQLYVNEFEFRYNNRKNPDIFGAAIRAC